MDIQIGKKTLSVNGVIYVSPNGNDNNNGTSTSTPVLSLLKAIELCSDNYAIYFMEGNHEFNHNNHLTLDLGNKNITFYSNPSNTLITLSLHNSSCTIGKALFTNGTYNLYNIKLFIKQWFDYPHISDGAIFNIYNSFIILGFSSFYIYSDVSSSSIIENSILSVSTPIDRKGIHDQNATIKNSVISNYFSKNANINNNNTMDNNANFNATENDIQKIFKEALSLSDDARGVYSGEYSEWQTVSGNKLKSVHIEKIDTLNLPSKVGLCDEIHIFFTNDKKLYVTDIYGVPHLIKSHVHNNSDVLNKFSVNSKGKLLFDGQSLDVSAGGSSVSFDEYTNLDTYKTNQYVIYNNKLYQCIADVTTPEEFDETKWNLIIGDNTKYITFKKVDSLPSENIDENCIYLIARNENSTDIDNYIEYMYIDNKWEILGPDISNNVSVSIGLTEW